MNEFSERVGVLVDDVRTEPLSRKDFAGAVFVQVTGQGLGLHRVLRVHVRAVTVPGDYSQFRVPFKDVAAVIK